MVSRAPTPYAGTDGFVPIAVYLGQEGWCLSVKLREGTHFRFA
jgi:hypothetical protein